MSTFAVFTTFGHDVFQSFVALWIVFVKLVSFEEKILMQNKFHKDISKTVNLVT